MVLKVLAEGRDPIKTAVKEIMTPSPVVCHQEDSVVRALKSMGEYQIRRIPIVDDDNHIIGIIAQADVATRIGEPMKTAEVVKEISKAGSRGA